MLLLLQVSDVSLRANTGGRSITLYNFMSLLTMHLLVRGQSICLGGQERKKSGTT